jgi:hypothetical protein
MKPQKVLKLKNYAPIYLYEIKWYDLPLRYW